jgi:uncharacterized protein YprB with RNaseH-like and TPR domain
MPANDNPRILFLDIETKLAEVYTFGIRDQHITHKQIKTHGGISCVGLKWAGERKVTVLSEWLHGYGEMLRLTHKALNECDAVATYNGAAFDIPKLNGAFMVAGLSPLPKLNQIDIYKAVRKMGFICNKLDYIAPLLGLGQKVKHEGMELWIKVLNGDEKAQAKMARYCAGDVRLTEDLYNRVLPYIADHPHLGRGDCPNCGSGHMQRRGYHKTRTFKTERLQCQECGSWRLGKREKIAA